MWAMYETLKFGVAESLVPHLTWLYSNNQSSIRNRYQEKKKTDPLFLHDWSCYFSWLHCITELCLICDSAISRLGWFILSSITVLITFLSLCVCVCRFRDSSPQWWCGCAQLCASSCYAHFPPRHWQPTCPIGSRLSARSAWTTFKHEVSRPSSERGSDCDVSGNGVALGWWCYLSPSLWDTRLAGFISKPRSLVQKRLVVSRKCHIFSMYGLSSYLCLCSSLLPSSNPRESPPKRSFAWR